MTCRHTTESRLKIGAASRRTAEARCRRVGTLYVAEVVGTDTVKIGYTMHAPERRIRKLNESNYRRMRYRLLAHAPGTFAQERELHRTLYDFRSEGFHYHCEYYPRSILAHPIVSALKQASYQTDPKWAARMVAAALASHSAARARARRAG